MVAFRPWLIWAVPFGLVAVLAPLLGLLPLQISLRATTVGCCLAVCLVTLDELRSRPGKSVIAAAVIADLLVRSLVGGAFLLLIAIAFYPAPNVANLTWMVGVPLTLALAQPHRSLGFLVAVVALSWLSLALLAFALRVPLD